MKENNQHYGRAFEEAIVGYLDNEEADFGFYDFPYDDLDNILAYALEASKYFENGKLFIMVEKLTAQAILLLILNLMKLNS